MFRRNKRIITLFLTFAMASQLLGASVAGKKLINNTDAGSDYKVTQVESDAILSQIKDYSDVHENFTVNSARLKSKNEIINWLAERNIINREDNLELDKDGINAIQKSIVNGESMSKSNTLSYLSRAFEGSINSRPFVWKTKAHRELNGKIKTISGNSEITPSNYEGSETSFDYSTGDYNIYISNTVNELYLSRLLQEKLITEDEISDKNFIKDYEKEITKDIAVVPEWSNQLQPYVYQDTDVAIGGQLGATWNVHNVFKLFTTKATSMDLTKQSHNFFVNENISKVETLKYISKMYKDKLTPIPLDKLEAFNFKYGSPEINDLSKEDKDLVCLFIYNGIINRDEDAECTSMNGEVNADFLFPILFRTLNTAERIEVTVEKISADEVSLAKEGYIRNDVNIYSGDSFKEPATVSVTKIKGNEKLITSTEYVPKFGDPDSDSGDETEDVPWYTKAWNATKSGATSAYNATARGTNYMYNSTKDYVKSEVQAFKDDLADDKNIGDNIKSLVKSNWNSSTDWIKWSANAFAGNDTQTEAKTDSEYKDIVEQKEEVEAKEEEKKQEEEFQEQAASNPDTKRESTIASASVGSTNNGESADFEIIKIFPNPDLVEYKGVKISSVSKTSPKDGGITDVSDVSGKKQVKFKINATSDVEALAVIDSKITYDSNIAADKKLQTITKVIYGRRNTIYMSAKEIERSFGELVVVSNKVLKNKKTGATAVLLSDRHKAMIGNRIVVTDTPIVITNTADTYYNIELLAPLMSNLYISSIDPGKMFVDNNLPVENLAQVTATTQNASGAQAQNLEKTMMISTSSWGGSLFSATEDYFNLDMVTRGISSLTREFDIEGKKAYLIMDWSYSLPDNDSSILDYFKNPNLNVKSASSFLFTKPAPGKAAEWWDNNLELSNGLANVMYDTKNVKYITSGYLKPDVTLLLPEDGASEEDTLKIITNKLLLPSEYLTKYCSKELSGFKDKLFNGGAGDLTKRREFNVITGVKSKENRDGKGANAVKKTTDYEKYDEEYVITATGAIYRNAKKDERLAYDPTKRELKISARTTDTSNGMESSVKIGDKNYYVQRMASNNFMGYIALTAMDGELGTYSLSAKGNYMFSETGSQKSMSDLITENIDYIKDNVTDIEDGNFKALAQYSELDYNYNAFPTGTINGSAISNATLMGGTAFLAQGKLVEFDGSQKMLPYSKLVTNTSKSCIAYPTIYVDSMNFSVENGRLIKKQSLPYIEQGNVLFSGLNSTLMSRLIDDNAEVIKYSELPNNCQVIIQDMTFKKTSKGLMSAPIADATFAGNLASSANNKTTLDSLILGRFSGLQLLFSGRPVSLTSYIISCGIGTREFEDTDKTFFSKGGIGYYSESKGTEALYSGQSIASACINVDLDADTQFYLLDASNQTYAMKYATDKYSDGYIDDISAFSEDLGFGIAQDIFLELKNNVFKPAENYEKIFEDYKLMYHSMLKGDIIGVCQFLFTMILSYIILASWIGLAILKGRVGLSILLAIRNPSGVKGAEGFDIIKFFTAGIWNLDSEPKPAQVFVANLLCFILLYLVIDNGTIIKAMFY